MAPVPLTFAGTPQAWAAEMVRRMRIVSPSGTNFIYIGDQEPTSNVGPWLKNGTKWYVFSDITNRYVPQDISESETDWFFMGNSTPVDTTPPVWLKTTLDGPNFGQPISWYVWNGANWVPFVGIVPAGATADRPTSPQQFQMFYDTDISVLIWFERSAWRTVSGVPGDIKQVAFETLAEAVLMNPGWELLGANNQAWRGRYPMQAAADFDGSNAVSVGSGVASRNAHETFGETDGIKMSATSLVPYPPSIAFWTLVKT